MEYKLLNYDIIGDERGSLVALEENQEIPFEIKRIYYIFGTVAGFVRGKHAHKKLEQIAICIHGSCKFHLDDGHQTVEIVLDKNTKGLYIGNNIWREMYDFSEDCVLLVIASEHYNANDYIRDYDAFRRFVLDQ